MSRLITAMPHARPLRRALPRSALPAQPTQAGAMSIDLLINAIVAGLLLGGFYAAVTVGISISFGMLDIVNIAHPAFIILGSYIAYIVNTTLRPRPDPDRDRSCCRRSTCSGAAVYQVYYVAFERRGQEALRGLAFFFGLLFITEVALILVFGVDYRYVEAAYIGPTWRLGFVDFPLRMLVPVRRLGAAGRRRCSCS